MQGAEFLFRHFATLEPMAQIAHHARALFLIVEEARGIQFRNQPAQENIQFALGRDMGFIGHQIARRRSFSRHPPFIGEDHHRLRQVERIMFRVQRITHQRIGARQILGFQPGAFGAE